MSCYFHDSPHTVQLILKIGTDANIGDNVRMENELVNYNYMYSTFDCVSWHTPHTWGMVTYLYRLYTVMYLLFLILQTW